MKTIMFGKLIIWVNKISSECLPTLQIGVEWQKEWEVFLTMGGGKLKGKDDDND